MFLCDRSLMTSHAEASLLHLFTFGWPKMNGVHLLPLTPSPHLPLIAPHLHVYLLQFPPQRVVLLLAPLALLVHL